MYLVKQGARVRGDADRALPHHAPPGRRAAGRRRVVRRGKMEIVQLITDMTHVLLMIAGTAGGGGLEGRDEGCADGDGQRAAQGQQCPRLGVTPDHPDGDRGAHRVGRGNDFQAQEELRRQSGIPSKKPFTNGDFVA